MTYKRKPTELPIADIRVGRRHRKDMGDIAELAASMAELGLLQAIGVRPNNELIWGERRLRAAQQLAVGPRFRSSRKGASAPCKVHAFGCA
jgi:ParB-like chromosome segregation protein Spo0J